MKSGVETNGKPFHIYGLFDPRDGAIKYVGRTNSPKPRMIHHMSKATNVVKSQWITELQSLGLRPEMVTIDMASTLEEAKEIERQWIKKCIDAGADLTNRIYPGCAPINTRRGYKIRR